VTFSTLSISKGGTYTLTATDSSELRGLNFSSTSITVTAVVGPAYQLAFFQQPTAEDAGLVIAPPVTVGVEDADGNVVTRDGSTMTLAIGPGSAPGTLEGASSEAAVSGVATFSTLKIASKGGTYKLTASDDDATVTLKEAESDSFRITGAMPVLVSGQVPAPGAVFVDRFAPIELHVTNTTPGVDLTTVTITASCDGGTPEDICAGLTADQTSYTATGASFPGTTYIAGTPTDYEFVFVPSAPYDFEEGVTISVTANDLAGNPMTLPVVNGSDAQLDPYSFTVATRSFGPSLRADGGTAGDAFPATATGAGGNVWVAWERPDPTTQKGTIWLAERAQDAWNFGSEIQVTTVAANILNTGGKGAPAAGFPRIAVTGSTALGNVKVFTIWQDNRSKTAADTDIEFAETNAGGTFGTNILVSVVAAGAGVLTNAAQSNPALGLKADGASCVAWTDLRQNDASHIYFASATDPVAFGTPWLANSTGGHEPFTGTNLHFTGVNINVPECVFATPLNIGVNELQDPVILCPSGIGIFADGSGLYLDITGAGDEELSNWVTITVTLASGATLPSPLGVYRLEPPATVLGAWAWTTNSIRDVSYNSTTRELTLQTKHLCSFGAGKE
jgi:hypothetical protein